jgi:hypothetical protein
MRGRAALALVAALSLGLGLLAGGDFSGIARRATPAVVNISATQVVMRQGRRAEVRVPVEERRPDA